VTPFNEKTVRLHMIVEGHVQGVGFRAFVLEQALRLGVKGWVRNRLAGQVEIMAEGDQVLLTGFLGVIKQGPRMSYVADVITDWSDATGEFTSFGVVRSS
jgi:acylphosphatase